MTRELAENVLAPYARPADLSPNEPSRLGRLLALDEDAVPSRVHLARQISAGLPPGAENTLVSVVGRKCVVGAVIPESTLRRARKAGRRLSRQASERLYGVYRVLDAVSRMYRGDPERIRSFLNSPHPLLDNETPLELAGTGSAGADSVVNLVQRAEAGVAL